MSKSSNNDTPNVEVREAFDKFCETAGHAKDVTAAATGLALNDLNEVIKVSWRSLGEETGRVKNGICGFKDEVLNNKRIVFLGVVVGAAVGGLVVYGLYFARKAYEKEEKENENETEEK